MRRFSFHYGGEVVRVLLSDPTPSVPSGVMSSGKGTPEKVTPLQPGLSTIGAGKVSINFVPGQLGKHGRVEIDAGKPAVARPGRGLVGCCPVGRIAPPGCASPLALLACQNAGFIRAVIIQKW